MGSRDFPYITWYFGDAEEQKLTQLLASVRPMITEIRVIAAGLPDNVRSVYVNKLDAFERELNGIQGNVTARTMTSSAYDLNVARLTNSMPAELVALRNIAQRDAATAGQASAALAEQQRQAKIAADKALDTNILVHPMAAAQAAGVAALEAGKSAAQAALEAAETAAGKVTDKATEYQWSLIKKAWPFLVLAGGALVLIYFGPALGRIASRMVGSGRVPGELPPGTMHQPGE